MKICKRCLLSELDGEGLYRSVKERIALIDGEQKTDEKSYGTRLSACQECDKLTNGMCALCGCFVELRAARKDMHCPDTPSKW